MDEITAKRQKKGKQEEEKPGEEKTILHGNIFFMPPHFYGKLSDIYSVLCSHNICIAFTNQLLEFILLRIILDNLHPKEIIADLFYTLIKEIATDDFF